MLRALGAQVEVHDSGLTVTGRKVLTGGTVDPQHDHRIAMSFLVAGFSAEGTTILENTDCIATSYPGFASDLERFLRI
jgi:3-phosphoshikimate 1-carboxyvinyltransferase